MPLPNFIKPKYTRAVTYSNHGYTFPMEPQEQKVWCWLAVAVSVERHYSPQVQITQGKLANILLYRNDCDGGTPAASCLTEGNVVSALQHFGRFDSITKSHCTFSTVATEVYVEFPLVVRIRWKGTQLRHVVVIHGFKELGPQRWVFVSDPDRVGIEQVSYDDMKDSYNGNGEWIATIFTSF